MTTRSDRRKKALANLAPVGTKPVPTVGDIYQVVNHMRDNYYSEGYVEDPSKAWAYHDMQTGDMFLFIDNRPFKLGREYAQVFSFRLQRKLYVATVLFGLNGVLEKVVKD